MVEYTILHHVPGRNRLGVPALKGKSFLSLMKLATVPLPSGVTDVHPNTLTGSLIIAYDPAKVDILSRIDEIASNPEILTVLRG